MDSIGYKQRVVDEYTMLGLKYRKLERFLDGDNEFVDIYQLGLMHIQLETMIKYYKILEKRLEAWK